VVAEWGAPDLSSFDGSNVPGWLSQFSDVDQAGLFIIIADTIPVGCIQFRTADLRHNVSVVSICMADADEQSHIRAADAVAILCTFLFQQRRIHRIEMTARDGGRWSQRLREHLGFQPEGILRESVVIEGRYHDEELLALIAPAKV